MGPHRADVETGKFKARLRMTEYRGQLSATMIYDDWPTNDVFRKVDAALDVVTPEEPDFDGTTVTVPTQTGVEYKNADTNTVLTTASPVTVAEGSALNVVANPTAGYYFPNSETDQWTFSNRA